MAKETKSNKEVKNKKHFWKDFKAELKKVIWPSPKQLSNKTFAVIVIVLITAAIVFVLDLVFDLLNEKGAFDISKCDLIAYANGKYFSLGEQVGKFGYSVQKKNKK